MHAIRTQLACMISLVLLSQEMYGQARFWVAPSGSPSGAIAPSPANIPLINAPIGQPTWLDIWARPEPGKTLRDFSLNVITSNPDTLEFTGVVVHNNAGNGASRFEFVFDETAGLDLDPETHAAFACYLGPGDPAETGLWGVRGFRIQDEGGAGIGPSTTDSDLSFDEVNNAWLLATFQVETLELSSTDLFLQIGEVGIRYSGESTNLFSASFGDPTDAALNAFHDRCVSSTTAEATIVGIVPLEGDFNHNGILDAGDINQLSAVALANSNEPNFDLSADSLVNQSDRTRWVETLAGTFFGDADLDGQVAFADFLLLSANFGLPGGWEVGDFDGDNSVQFGDFLILSTNFGIAASMPMSIATPEPNGPFAWMLLLVWFPIWRRLVVRENRPRISRPMSWGGCFQASISRPR